MNKFLLPIGALILSHTVYGQILNGDFDHWTKVETFAHPVMGAEVMSSNPECFIETGTPNVTAVEVPDGQGMRLENRNAGEFNVPAYFITGTVPEQEGESLIFGGGMPVPDEGISGVSLQLRHSIAAESPGFVIVQFKHEGEPVGTGNMGPGTHMVALEGDMDWYTVEVDFEDGFTESPDECVVAMATANLLSDDGEFPSSSWLEVSQMNWINGSDDMLGGSLDTWAWEPPFYLPENVVVRTEDALRGRVERSAEPHSGTFAMALHTTTHEEWTEPTRATFGEGTVDDIIPNVIIGDEHTTFSFMYKCDCEDDMAHAWLRFYTQNEEGDFEVVHDKMISLEANNEYTAVEYHFAEELESVFAEPTHMSVEFQSSTWMDGNEPKDGSTLWIDQVALSGALNAFARSAAPASGIIGYPNPTMGRVIIDLQMPRSGFFRLFNQVGRQVDIQTFQSQQEFIYDLSGFPSGQYFFRFQHNGGVEVLQVIKI